MKSGEVLGIVGAIAGIGIGVFLAVLPVMQELRSGVVSGSEAGMYFAVMSTIIGFSCAAVGSLYCKLGSRI